VLQVAAIVVALLGGRIAAARAQDAIAIDIFEYGIYTAETVKPATGANAEMKPAEIRNICHVMTTRVVPARDSLNFGFRYRVRGGVSGQAIEMKKYIRFPDHMNPPQSLSTYAVNEQVLRIRSGAASYTGWTMWHTFPGLWTFWLSVGDRKLVEISFTVVEKDQIRVEADGDSTCFQVS
jgi:hypothetical protein